jgi:hypothetical protein
MQTVEQLKKEAKFTSDILDLMEHRDEITQSDLQGVLAAVYRKYFVDR